MRISRGTLAFVSGAGLQVASAAFIPRQTDSSSLPSLPSISNQCLTSVTNLLSSPDGECMNLSALTSFVLFPDNPPEQTLNNWLTGMCNVGMCSDSALENIMKTLMTDCADDLQKLQDQSGDLTNTTVPTVSVQQATDAFKQGYPLMRNILCLKDNTSGNFCALDEMDKAEKAFNSLDTNSLGVSNSTDISAALDGVLPALMDVASGVLCTSCMKAVYNIANEAYPSTVSQASDILQGMCGDDFTDGAAPAGVEQIASNSLFVAEKDGSVSGLLRGFSRYLLLSPAVAWAVMGV